MSCNSNKAAYSLRQVFFAGLALSLTGCSALFENIYNSDGSQKTGDSSLTAGTSSNTDVSSGLVVIKASEPDINQITYSADQTTYYVGAVPSGYSDGSFEEIGYTNASSVQLVAKDDPAEFRCFPEDPHATVSWKAEQTWRYIPQTQTNTVTNTDGSEDSYVSVVGQTALELDEAIAVPVYPLSGSYEGSRINAAIPYGVTVLTCTITADDQQYTSSYRIVVTKRFITTVADSVSDSESSAGNNVTDHGLVVIKATQPGLNAIVFDPTTYEYEIGDSTGQITSADLTGRDDPITFKCFLLDENASLSWSAVQTKRYVVEKDENNGGIIGQTLEELEEHLPFDLVAAGESYEGTGSYLQFASADSDAVVLSTLPYGVTEVYATITAQNTNAEGETVTDTTQYKITLTKRYVITSAVTDSSSSEESGLAVYVSGKDDKNLISYSPEKTSYAITGLNGANELGMVRFAPEEPDFTTVTWTAFQTQSYTPQIKEYTSGSVTYTYQSGGSFTDLATPIDLLTAEKFHSLDNGSGRYFCGGDLPYGTTVVTVTASSTADAGNSITYTVTFKKKQVATNANIVADDESTISLITDNGLVVLSAQNPDVNQIVYSPSTYNYSLEGITAADNDMGFRLFLADTDARLEWSVQQTKTFEPVIEKTTETVTDELLGTETTVTTITVTGQTETQLETPVDIAFTPDTSYDTAYSDHQAITATIPYGVTVVTATVHAPGEADTVYTITLTRDIVSSSSSSSSTTTSYSLLEELTVDVSSGSSDSRAVLTPDFSPTTTTYTLEVDEEADSITIDATAASDDAEISAPVAITKYGTVPGLSGSTVPLVGGTSRITFTVTDETGISRTYTIYVTKTGDGDTSLSALDCTPGTSFDNGVKGYTFDSTYTGASGAGTAKYAVTLSADSRVDVSELTFTAVPTNKRTTVAYGVTNSISSLPADEEWSDAYSYATQTSGSAVSYTVSTGDEAVDTLTRVLWVKTVSDSYYHYTSSGYESEKRADTSYHAVKITKAGDANQKLTALVVVAGYEDGTTKQILSQTTSDTVAWTTTAVSTSVTTYADQLDFYFRTLDKDAAVTYSALNTAYEGGEENITFTGYAAEATSEGIETLSSCSYLDDGASEYYHFTLGEIVKGTGVSSQTADLPNGTTKVTICGVTYTFVKPNLESTSYSVSGWTGSGSGIDSSSRSYYIYVTHDTQSVVLSLNVTQQNATVRVKSIEQTAGANESAIADDEKQNASYAVLHKDTSSDGLVSNSWKVSIGNATYSADGYSRTAPDTLPDTSTILPVGTTKVLLYVDNNNTSKDYTYYIIREDDSEARLKTLTLTNPDESSKTVNLEPTTFTSGWKSVTDGATYVLSDTAYTLDQGTITLRAIAVSDGATISVTKSHTNTVSVTDISAVTDWETAADVENTSTTAGSFSGSYEITESDTGTLLFTITVTSRDKSVTYTYNLLAYVEADTTATLTALRIVQKGSEDSYSNAILANSFDSETLEYSDLGASLSYTGDIVVTPTVYEKATITSATVSLSDADSIEIDAATVDEDYVLTLPYSYYSQHLGSSLVFAITVQAQDASVTATYRATVALPSLTTITETDTYSYSTEYSYILPQTESSSLVAYRFGSLIADETTFLGKDETSSPGTSKSYFGGIDIIGTSDRTTWYESSFGQSGFQLAMHVADSADDDGSDYWLQLDENGSAITFYTVDFTSRTVTALTAEEVAELGICLTVSPSFQYEGDTPYLSLAFAVTNSKEKVVKLGASIDTLVGTIADSTDGTNDRVTVEETDNGFVMLGEDYTFTVVLKNAYGVDDVSRLWYGAYDSASFSHMKVFENESGSLAADTDSAASFSWDLGTEASYTKTVRINMSKAE